MQPRRRQWEGVTWILRYLKGTIDVGLIYGGDDMVLDVIGYSDLDYA